MELQDYRVFDCETFENNWLVCFIDLGTGERLAIWDDVEALRAIDFSNCVGFNSHGFDDHIINIILKGGDMNRLMSRAVMDGLKSKGIRTLDAMQQFGMGLKECGAYLKMGVEECPVPFDIDRPLTTEEKALVEHYCFKDCEVTAEVLTRRLEYFEQKQRLAELSNGDEQWNTTTLAAQYLLGSKKVTFPNPPWHEITDELQPIYSGERTTLNITENMLKIKIGIGGIHGHNGLLGWHDLLIADVTALYPSIIVKFHLLPPGAHEKYKELLEARIRDKHIRDTSVEKLLLNSVYGLLRNEYSKLYSPKTALFITLYGQQVMLDLVRGLNNVILTNTDSVFIPLSERENSNNVFTQWEETTGLKLDYEEGRCLIKDVNNYLIVSNGKDKRRGADLKKSNGLTRGQPPVLADFFKEPLIELLERPIEDFGWVVHCARGLKLGDEIIGKTAIVYASLEGKPLYRIMKDGTTRLYGKVPAVTTDPEKIDKDWYITEALRIRRRWGLV